LLSLLAIRAEGDLIRGIVILIRIIFWVVKLEVRMGRNVIRVLGVRGSRRGKVFEIVKLEFECVICKVGVGFLALFGWILRDYFFGVP